MKVMLLGHNDNFVEDENMKVTIAFNYFGPGLIERLPRYINMFHLTNKTERG